MKRSLHREHLGHFDPAIFSNFTFFVRSRAYDTTEDLGSESLIPFTDFLRVVASGPNTEWVVDRTGWSAGRL